MIVCQHCIYNDKLKNKIESQICKKEVIYCNFQNKIIEKKQLRNINKCDMFYSVNPE